MFKQFILTYHKIQDKKHHLSSTPSTISPALSRFHRIPLFFCSKDPRTQISHNAFYERIILVQILERGIIHQDHHHSTASWKNPTPSTDLLSTENKRNLRAFTSIRRSIKKLVEWWRNLVRFDWFLLWVSKARR